MSAPDTNVRNQERAHRPSLWGIWGALIVVALLFVGWLAFYSLNPAEDGATVETPAATGSEAAATE
ncbi:hypothetical protein [Salipiger mucosus]|uniref:Uncharacterized protein n=1 Tax=Salipiger mucosus DSM 16094 TaxID=1123237 RepID=S9RVF5_9RHOB|nr:hypothetical protein [Salipiger mucosus]EPX81990.1 hypothetical protein Salmuc_02354 [Salipiger mucosus DSM 16094]